MLHWIVGAMALVAVPCLASAQESKTAGPQDLSRAAADPVDKITGVWRVDRLDGTVPSDALQGRVLKVDRQSVTTLISGSCTSPSFAQQLGEITITCLGQALANARWDPQAPGRLQWSEGSLAAVLSRISGTEALKSPPAAAAAEGEGASESGASEGEDQEGTEDEGAGDAQ